MGKDHIVAVDVGLSFSKAIRFDGLGRVVGASGAPTPTLPPSPGRSELDPAELWLTVAAAIKEAVGDAGGQVAAVGVSGHGNGLYALDAKREAVGPAITSMDQRAEARPGAWPGQPGSLLRWLRESEPERFRRVACAMSCKDFLSFRLTGELATDWSDASASGMLDDVHAEFAPLLPPIVRSFELRGEVTPEAAAATGMAAGTPVIGGMFDVDACVHGAGVTAPGQLCCVAGTWNINAAALDHPIAAKGVRHCVRRGDGESYLLIDSSATSASNINWARQRFFPGSSDFRRLEQVLEGHAWNANSPFWLPFVNGSLGTAARKGAVVGLDASHGMDDLLAAVFEGICFAHRFHLERLAAAGAAFDRVRLTGGAATPAFCQLFANVCGLPVETLAEKQSGAAGIRIAATVALGQFPDMATAARKLVNVDASYSCAERRLFNDRYQHFKELIECPL